jgi:hypothetical protein
VTFTRGLHSEEFTLPFIVSNVHGSVTGATAPTPQFLP